MEQGSEEEEEEEEERQTASPVLNARFCQPGRHGGETSDGPFAAGRRPEQLLSRL